jgi:hypothetical protein
MDSPSNNDEDDDNNDQKRPRLGRKTYKERMQEEKEAEERVMMIKEFNLMKDTLDKMCFRINDVKLQEKRDLPFPSWRVCPTENLFIWVTYDSKVWDIKRFFFSFLFIFLHRTWFSEWST